MLDLMTTRRIIPLSAMLFFIVAGAACGGSSETALSQAPVSARVIVTDVQVSADETRVESITVVTDDGEEISMTLGADIGPPEWGPPHLLSHAGLGKTLGLKIEVTYIPGDGPVTVIKLSE